MRVWLGLTAPKQVLFFGALGVELYNAGHDVYYTSRKYYEMNALEIMLGLETTQIGYHGGRKLSAKLSASIYRMNEMQHYVQGTRPDIMITLGGVEESRIAFGLGIPIVSFMDIPEAVHVCKLSLPLATIVLHPQCVAPETLAVYNPNLQAYDSQDPVLWLQSRILNKHILVDLGLSGDRPLVVVRDEETKAAYLSGQRGVVGDVVTVLNNRHPDWQIVALPRYDATEFKGTGAIVPRKVVDAQSLLSRADLFIGGGGTMNIEAAYYGTPVLCCRPLTCQYEDDLVEHGLATKVASRTPGEIADMAEEMLHERTDIRARNYFGKRPFPVDEVIKMIEKTGRKK